MSILASEGEGALLRLSGLTAHYGELRALANVTFEVARGQILSIIGANGAGKSTLLKSIMGMMNRGRTARVTGRIEFRGRRIDALPTDRIVNAGLSMVPEGRRLFASLTVEENLLAGAYLPRCRAGLRDRIDELFALFPRLAERRGQIVSRMSGGEQQMVAIGRALMSDPELVLFDELSLGLAPLVVDDIYEKVRAIHDRGVTSIVVEQDVKRALSIADRVFVMLEGALVLEGAPDALSEEAVTAAYFGSDVGAAGA